MSQMNPKEFVHNTAYSVWLPYKPLMISVISRDKGKMFSDLAQIR